MTEVNNLTHYNNRIEQLNDLLKTQEENIKLGESLERLLRNRDFKRVIQEGFLRDNAARSIKMSSNLKVNEEQRLAAENTAKAAGYLEQYFVSVLQMYDHAKSNIEKTKDSIVEERMDSEV